MTPLTALAAVHRAPVAIPRTTDCVLDAEHLGDAIAELAARLHAATYDLLVLLRQFDEACGWNTGFRSCAHWLHWRTGIDLGAAREKVRVAKALAVLPRLSAVMRRGEVSYAKVRAITRVATPQNEAQLVDVARCGTAAHVERLVRAWRRVDRVEAALQTEVRHLERHLTTWVDDDGMVVLRGRLTPEVGAVVQRALEAAADRLFHESAQAPNAGGLTDEVTAGQRRADALGLLAECALSADLDRGTAGDRYQVVLHVDVDSAPGAHAPSAMVPVRGASVADDVQTVVELDDAAGRVRRGTDRWPIEESDPTKDVSAEAYEGVPHGHSTGHTVVEVGDGAIDVSAATYERLSCDAAVVVMRHHADGSVLDVGRRTRSIPPAIRRALMARDPYCQFPGCPARRCDAHHLTHWAHGGATRLDNLVHLCRWHHRLVHEGGYRLTRDGAGDVRVTRPDGTPLPTVPRPPRWTARRDDGPLAPTTARLAAAGLTIGPYTATPRWDGHPFDVGWAIDVLRGHPVFITSPPARPPSSMIPGWR